MKNIKSLKLGDLIIRKPVIQGGMGVGISLSSLAGAVARAGGLGIISAAQIGYREPDFKKNPVGANIRAIFSEMKKAREIARGGAVGFNIMVASRDYGEYVRAAVKAGADIIISGAGLPTSLPGHVREAEAELAASSGDDTDRRQGTGAGLSANGLRTRLAPIVSSLKSASVICRYWEKKYHMLPDMVVIEGPLAGGHLGFTREKLKELGADTEAVGETFKKSDYDSEILSIIDYLRDLGKKHGREIPIAIGGGVYTHGDVMEQLGLGADAVQVATRFVTTKECDAPPEFKKKYLDAAEDDIIIVKSPVGMPGRAIKNRFLDDVSACRIAPGHCTACLTPCDPASTPYCITEALINAANGDTDRGLIFCGSNAWKADRIETVDEVMEDLMGA